jgi:uncharacterized protein
MNTDKFAKFLPVISVLVIVFLGVQILSDLKAMSYIGSGEYGPNVISVSGEGEKFVAPDTAVFTFGVSETAKDIKTAQDTITAKVNTSIDALKKMGIEEKDIKTVDFNAHPRYEYRQIVCISNPCPGGRQELVGYEVTQMISVKVRNVDDAGKAIDTVTKAGITNVSGLNFVVDDEGEALREARKMAIEDARKKAEILADDLEVRLVRIVSFSEGNNGYPMPMYAKAESMMGNADQSAPSLPTGENRVVVNVTIAYEIR